MVIDAILFTDELDMLELRLHELDSVVDKFVIVEALEAHGSSSRRPEPSLQNKWDLPWLKPFARKISYEVLTQLKPEYTDGQSGWARENAHRNRLMQPVLQISKSPNDIIMVSDVDEIPRVAAVRRYLSGPPPGVTLFRLDHYFYNVNCYGGVWMRSSIGPLSAYQEMGGFQAPRGHLGDVIERQVRAIGNGGWHFSSFFSIPRLREKLKNFAHSFEVKLLLDLTDEELMTIIRARRNMFTGGELAKRVTRNPSLPQYFLENLERFKSFTEEGQCMKAIAIRS